MSEKRTLTIGVAINLGNYESLRLEVSDEVQSEEDAAALAAYLNQVLDGYGQNDISTRASIDKYRARVLKKHAVPTPPVQTAEPLDDLMDPALLFDGITAEEEGDASSQEPADVQEEFIAEILPAPSTPEPDAEEQTQMPEPVIFETITTEPLPPEPPVYISEKTAEVPVVYTCEKCGAAVSKVQRDVSNLFMGKTLCKTCMK